MITLPILHIRTLDIWILLVAGAVLELVTKSWSILAKTKSKAEVEISLQARQLNHQAAQKRRLGPSAFVETSKLERQALAKEKELSAFVETRKKRQYRVAKLVQRFSMTTYILVFALYYSHAILSIDGTRVLKDDAILSQDEAKERASSYLQALLFPISYIGVGMRVSRFGLSAPGFGALVVLWSAQVTTAKIMDGIEWLIWT